MTTTPEEEPGAGSTAEQAVLDAVEDVVDDVTERELGADAESAMQSLDNPRRLLLVHAHPDDETITSGATMAHYASAGAQVTLVTCTRGEQGEVIPSGLAHLAGDGDALAEHRVVELATAMEALGVSDHRFLGDGALGRDGRPDPVRYRDSGMAYDDAGNAVAPPDMAADAFARTDVDEAAAHLVRVVREVRPQVVVTYEPGGGYGHPDHVQAHRVTMRAVVMSVDPDVGGGEPWQVAKVYWLVLPEKQVRAALRELADAGGSTRDPDGPLPTMVVPDHEVTTVVDAPEQLDAKAAALRAHATQVVVSGGTFALSNGFTQPLWARECYRLAAGEPRPPADGGPETDLFAGLA
jgi:N-acetyl-1-D-myo-inositol-2-amino-2-deoxy-alpha-D-glucopyranoside deacetylase